MAPIGEVLGLVCSLTSPPNDMSKIFFKDWAMLCGMIPSMNILYGLDLRHWNLGPNDMSKIFYKDWAMLYGMIPSMNILYDLVPRLRLSLFIVLDQRLIIYTVIKFINVK